MQHNCIMTWSWIGCSMEKVLSIEDSLCRMNEWIGGVGKVLLALKMNKMLNVSLGIILEGGRVIRVRILEIKSSRQKLSIDWFFEVWLISMLCKSFESTCSNWRLLLFCYHSLQPHLHYTTLWCIFFPFVVFICLTFTYIHCISLPHHHCFGRFWNWFSLIIYNDANDKMLEVLGLLNCRIVFWWKNILQLNMAYLDQWSMHRNLNCCQEYLSRFL